VLEEVLPDGYRYVILLREDGFEVARAKIDSAGFASEVWYEFSDGSFTYTWVTKDTKLLGGLERDADEGNLGRSLLTNCSSGSWLPIHGRIWTTTKQWRFYAGSVPSDINVDSTEASFVRAHDQWKLIPAIS
jgi:hypothetical protein